MKKISKLSTLSCTPSILVGELTLIEPLANKPVASFAHLAYSARSSGLVFIRCVPHGASAPRSVYAMVASVVTSERAGWPLSKRRTMRCPPLGEKESWASWTVPFSDMLFSVCEDGGERWMECRYRERS